MYQGNAETFEIYRYRMVIKKGIRTLRETFFCSSQKFKALLPQTDAFLELRVWRVWQIKRAERELEVSELCLEKVSS